MLLSSALCISGTRSTGTQGMSKLSPPHSRYNKYNRRSSLGNNLWPSDTSRAMIGRAPDTLYTPTTL